MLKTISLGTDNNSEWSITFSCTNKNDCITTEYSVKRTHLLDDEPPEGDSIHDPDLTKQMLDKELDLLVLIRNNHLFLQEARYSNGDLEKFLK